MTDLLLVEDEADLASIMSRRLQRRGYNVTIASDGNTGVEMAIEHRPDVIIMDLLLVNGPNGTEATRQIKSFDGTIHIPIIIVSASHLASFQEEAFDAGANDVDSKPIDFDRLHEKIQGLLKPDGG